MARDLGGQGAKPSQKDYVKTTLPACLWGSIRGSLKPGLTDLVVSEEKYSGGSEAKRIITKKHWETQSFG